MVLYPIPGKEIIVPAQVLSAGSPTGGTIYPIPAKVLKVPAQVLSTGSPTGGTISNTW